MRPYQRSLRAKEKTRPRGSPRLAHQSQRNHRSAKPGPGAAGTCALAPRVRPSASTPDRVRPGRPATGCHRDASLPILLLGLTAQADAGYCVPGVSQPPVRRDLPLAARVQPVPPAVTALALQRNLVNGVAIETWGLDARSPFVRLSWPLDGDRPGTGWQRRFPMLAAVCRASGLPRGGDRPAVALRQHRPLPGFRRDLRHPCEHAASWPPVPGRSLPRAGFAFSASPRLPLEVAPSPTGKLPIAPPPALLGRPRSGYRPSDLVVGRLNFPRPEPPERLPQRPVEVHNPE